jgi:transcriptional regulator of arginine metabolism
MPSDREIRDRRREAIREILLHGDPVSQQGDLVLRLEARGFAATQSNVSRDLRDIGAVRREGVYQIPSWADATDESDFLEVARFIQTVKTAGPHQTLLVTEPGAGWVVAQAIELDNWDGLVGTHAAHNSVLLLTSHAFWQRILYDRLKFFLSKVGTVVMDDGDLTDDEPPKVASLERALEVPRKPGRPRKESPRKNPPQ